MTLAEIAFEGFARHKLLTKDYRYTSLGLSPSHDIVSFVQEQLSERGPSESDEDRYLDLIREGKGIYESARDMGWDTMQLTKRLQYDSDFETRVHIAQAESVEPIIKSLREIATNTSDVQAALRASMKLLEVYDSDQFGNQKKQDQDKPFTPAKTGNALIDDINETLASIKANKESKKL